MVIKTITQLGPREAEFLSIMAEGGGLFDSGRAVRFWKSRAMASKKGGGGSRDWREGSTWLFRLKRGESEHGLKNLIWLLRHSYSRQSSPTGQQSGIGTGPNKSRGSSTCKQQAGRKQPGGLSLGFNINSLRFQRLNSTDTSKSGSRESPLSSPTRKKHSSTVPTM